MSPRKFRVFAFSRWRGDKSKAKTRQNIVLSGFRVSCGGAPSRKDDILQSMLKYKKCRPESFGFSPFRVGGAKSRMRKPDKMAFCRVVGLSTFRLVAPPTRKPAMAQISHHSKVMFNYEKKLYFKEKYQEIKILFTFYYRNP